VRGVGSHIAFDASSMAARDDIVHRMKQKGKDNGLKCPDHTVLPS